MRIQKGHWGKLGKRELREPLDQLQLAPCCSVSLHQTKGNSMFFPRHSSISPSGSHEPTFLKMRKGGEGAKAASGID